MTVEPVDPAEVKSLVELLCLRARHQPQRRIYSFEADDGTRTHLTYAELDARARAVAARLQDAGAAGGRALLVYPPGLDYVAAVFGCLYAGTAAVPVYPPRANRGALRLLSVLADARAHVVLTTTRARDSARAARLPTTDAPWLASDEIPAGAAAAWRNPRADPDTLALVQYTSGSTSAPKGVLLSHGNLLHNLGLMRAAFGVGPHSRAVIWLPPYHDMGLIGGILEPLYADFPVLLMSPVTFLQNPLRWLAALARERATTSGGPNFAYELCARRVTPEQRAGLDLSSWDVAFNGAEPVRPETLEAFARAFEPCGFRREAFVPCYGLAEGTLLVSGRARSAAPAVAAFDSEALGRHEVRALPAGEPGARVLVGSGSVAGSQRVVVVDPESGAELPPGRVGELWIAGPSVTRGYWNRPEASERACHARLAGSGEGPFLRTGDLGFVRDGELFVTGRIKDLIIIRGRNHYPQDVELTAERAHPALRPSCGAVFAVDVQGDERLVVVYEAQRERRGVDVGEVARAVRRAVADEHEVQVHAVVLLKPGSVPKTSSGKVQRHACKAGFLEGGLDVLGEWREARVSGSLDEPREAPVESAADLARWLRVQVATRLRVPLEELALDQPCSQAGLDSLQALELAHAVEERFGVALPLQQLFDARTLSALAAEIFAARSAAAQAQAVAAPPRQPGVTRPLSPGQRALWFLQQLEPESAAYNVGATVRILGTLHVPALQRALSDLVARHAPLRTTFASVDGEPVALVQAPGEFALEELDASSWSEAELRAWLNDETHTPFDLARGPLLRAMLVTCGPGKYVLSLAMHHIVTDFWSLAVVLRDLEAFYVAARDGRAPDLAPLDVDYDAYAEWQDALVGSADGERQLDYWRRQLQGELPVLDLRTDRPRPAVQTYRGAALPVVLEPDLCEQLKALGRGCDATPFMVLLAAFQVLLARHAGQDGVVVGTPTSGRMRARWSGLVGYFVNPLALRADLSDDPPFSAFLAQVRQAVLGAFEHQAYPFAGLVEKLVRQRDPGRTPLFQAMFALQSAPPFAGQSLTTLALGEERASVRWGGLTLELMAFRERVAQFDLTLNLGEVGGGLRGSLNYNTDLFDVATVGRLVRHFETLLRGIVADPERRVSTLPLLGSDETRRQLVEWNATAADYPRESCVHDLIAEQARRTPEALAVVAGGRVLRYAELAQRARQVAARLRALGVGPERLVGICLDSSIEVVTGILGVLEAGGAWLPLDPAFPRERLKFMARDAGLCAILTQERHQGALPRGLPLLALDHELPDAPDAEAPASGVTADNAACAIYTSGSTGEPKGTLLTHGAVVNLITSFVRSYDVGPADRILPLTSIAYASFVGEVLPLLCAGGTVVLPERDETLDIERLHALLAGQAVSIVSTVPALVRALVGLRLPRLRLLLSGGEALTPADVGELQPNLMLVNGYGLTETTVCSTYHRVTGSDLRAPGAISVGQPIMNTRVYVLDSELQPVPLGAAGELYIAGHGLARGYLGRPALTAERFVPDPFQAGERMYDTGDLAAWSRDGRLHSLGRRDHQVKIRGFRIDLEEIEVVLARHDAVRECAVVAREDVPGEKRLVAYVVAADGAVPSAGALIGHLRDRLPEHMLPAAFQFLDVLPRTHAGKVDARALPAPASVRPELTSAYVAPRSELERSIAGVWQELLRVDKVGLDDNFFDLGGHSLLLTRLQSRLRDVLARELSLVELFRYPTVSALARHLHPPDDEAQTGATPQAVPALASARTGEIAVIAVAGRFPGARDVEELWRNLERGVESITFFGDDELIAAGVDPALVVHPDYVKAKGLLGDVDLFDAPFFGLSPRETELMDPQHRLLLECAHEALERAGYDGAAYTGRVGVYAGESMNTYMLANILPGLELVASVETLQASLGNDKDPLTARIAYKLDLKGPAITIQSASSTSLVAVHVACKALHEGECDMALAGGVSVHLPEKSGYMYHEGGTTSRHGHCRAFDARADGFVPGNGLGLVVLKRLADARRDGDNVLAVIKGSACNNDGSRKISFMAPSVDGQIDVYARAHAAAGTTPDTLGYVECHGTGTAMGDPIEFEALSQHFRRHTQRRQCCALGSLKTNIGHLDTAAGVCGLIKTVLSLQHETLPPTLHFEQPNPQIDFESSPFFVNTTLRPWPADGRPRRAGVTSLGMGGTNAHVIVEEAPPPEPADVARPWQLVLLSARSPAALERQSAALAARLRDAPTLALADVAYTLQVGRKRHEHRRALVCRDVTDALAALETLDPARVVTQHQEPGERSLYFLFSGQGAQHVGMARELYEHEPTFRATFERCCDLVAPHVGCDLRDVLYPSPEQAASASERLRQTALTQPALFAVEYALATLWMRWGLRPRAMLGHSLGEYVAACLAGVMELEDALRLVAARGRLMQAMPAGSMLAVPLPEGETRALLGDELDLAAVNCPTVTVVSGSDAAVARLEQELLGRGVQCRRLHTSHAFHSRSMEPMLAEFAAQVRAVPLRPPRLPYVSNVTGTWIRPEQATDPGYWAQQLRQTVRFGDGLGELLRDPAAVFLEVGPGQTLTALARQHPDRAPGQAVVASLPHAREERSAYEHLLGVLGRLWSAGASVDWSSFHAGMRRRRVLLPTYPFERQRYWVDPPAPDAARRQPKAGKRPFDEWFHVPLWTQAPPRPPVPRLPAERAPWLVLCDGLGLGDALVAHLRAAGQAVVSAHAGPAWRERAPGEYVLDPGDARQHEELLRAAGRPHTIVHLWALTGAARDAAPAARAQRDLEALLALARAAGAEPVPEPARLWIVADGLAEVTGAEDLHPEKALLQGAARALPWELPHATCHVLDLPVQASDHATLAAAVLGELALAQAPALVALRGRARWVQRFERLARESEPAPLPLRDKGVYLVTGGLGGLGLEMAAFLARAARARLVLVGRSELPTRDQWARLLGNGADERLRERLQRVQALEAAGAEVLTLSADVANRDDMQRVKTRAQQAFGRVDGVVHAAGVPGAGLLAAKRAADVAAVLRPKLHGTLVLDALFGDDALDFFVVCSSITAVLGQVGQADYAAANAFLDAWAVARARAGRPALSIGWDAWQSVGMAAHTAVPEELRAWREAELRKGLLPEEGVAAFERLLRSGLPHVVVSTEDLGRRLSETRANVTLQPAAARDLHPRPALASAYAAPASPREQAIARVWQELLGIEQVGVHDNFFELGGDSLMALSVVARLKQDLEVTLSDVSLFKAPTVSSLARLLDDAGAATPPVHEASRERGARRRAGQARRRPGPARE